MVWWRAGTRGEFRGGRTSRVPWALANLWHSITAGAVLARPTTLTIDTREGYAVGPVSIHTGPAQMHVQPGVPMKMMHSLSLSADLDLSAILKLSTGSPLPLGATVSTASQEALSNVWSPVRTHALLSQHGLGISGWALVCVGFPCCPYRHVSALGDRNNPNFILPVTHPTGVGVINRSRHHCIIANTARGTISFAALARTGPTERRDCRTNVCGRRHDGGFHAILGQSSPRALWPTFRTHSSLA